MTNLQRRLFRLADRAFLRVAELFGDLADATAEPVNGAVAIRLKATRESTGDGVLRRHHVTFTPSSSIKVKTVHAYSGRSSATIERVFFGTDIVIDGPINTAMIDPMSFHLPRLAAGRSIWAGVPITVEWTANDAAIIDLVFTGPRQRLRGRPEVR